VNGNIANSMTAEQIRIIIPKKTS